MIEQLPALLVAIPMVAALICALLPGTRVAWGWATLVSWAVFAMAILLLREVLQTGLISYDLGGWVAPYGIELRVDYANGFVALIVAGIGAAVAPFARASLEREIPEESIPRFYAAYLLCLTGLLGITITGDVFNLFVFLEVSSLTAYTMVGMGQDRRALTAAYRYLIMGSIGATFIVIGIGLLYSMTGTLNMADLAARIPDVQGTRTVPVAFGFLTVGIGLKLALFPLHLWLPNAYTYAPSAATAFLAATATKVAVYVLLRFFFTVFGAEFSFDVMRLDWVLLPLGLVAILTMSLVAIFQENVKRMLAYSSLAQIGYMVIGISMASVTGLTGGIVHLFNHALMKSALFLAVGAVFYRIGTVRITAMSGLGKQMPWTMGAFVLGGLSLIGVPLTVGFVSKWYLIVGAVERGWWPVAVLMLISSLLAVIYVWRVVEAAYFREPIGDPEEIREAPLSLLIPTWALILATLYFGVDASLTAGVAGQAAELLLGASGVGP